MTFAEDEDYEGFNKTVTLTFGDYSTIITATIIDDNIFEEWELFVIQMELVEQPLSAMIHIRDNMDKIKIWILDDEGWFYWTLLLKIRWYV